MSQLFIPLYLDEDVDVLLADLIRARGFTVTTTRDAGNLHASDEQQPAYAGQQRATLFTHNRIDFEMLATTYFSTSQHHAGIIIAVRHPVHEIARRLLIILNHVTADEMHDQLRYMCRGVRQSLALETCARAGFDVASCKKSLIKEGEMEAKSPNSTDEAFSYDIVTGIREWREQHPKATLREIEAALDERWYRVRARMFEDLALQTQATSWQATTPAERPTCPGCGRTLIRRGRQPRQLKTHGGQDITLSRAYGYCPTCKKGHFPPRP